MSLTIALPRPGGGRAAKLAIVVIKSILQSSSIFFRPVLLVGTDLERCA